MIGLYGANFWGKTDGRRKAGRPKLRWLDFTKYGLKLMGVKRGKKRAEYRFV